MRDLKSYTYQEVLEIFEYYKTHTKVDTCKKFNIGSGKFGSILNFYGFKKSKEDISLTKKLVCENKLKEGPDIWVKRNLKTARTLQERTGNSTITNVFQLNEVKDRIIETQLNNNPGLTIKKIRSINAIKGNDTKEAKYGYRGVNQEKSKKTKLERYGDPYYCDRSKAKATIIKKFGSWNNYHDYWLKSVINTNRLKRGVDWWQQTPEWNNLLTNIFQDTYGVNRYSQLPIWASEVKKLYKYNGLAFDSLWELQYYIYCVNHNIDIKRCDKVFYYIFNNKTYIYHPDFEVNGELIEIKGDHFFKEDGTMCNPFDHSQDDLYEAKHQCGLINGVKYLSSNELLPCFIWCKENNFKLEDYIEGC